LKLSANSLANEVDIAIRTVGIVTHTVTQERVFAYEVDGFGSVLLMDDANNPSLLSLPLMGYVDNNDPVYLATRRALLSSQTK
jgi:meiotically up-regulated gene 157 (Mug157) protein